MATERPPEPPCEAEPGVDDCVDRIVTSYQRYQRAGIPEVSHDVLDDTHILNRWIAGHTDHPAVTVLDRERVYDRDYWRSVVQGAVRIPDRELVLEVTGNASRPVEQTGDHAGTAPE